MVSVAEGLRMMQGGVDRTGFADMADALGNPGLDLIRERRAAAAEAAAMDEFEKRMEAMLPGNQDLIGGEGDKEGDGGKQDSDFSFNSIFRDPYTTVDETTGEITDQSKGEAILSRGTTAAALTPIIRRVVAGGKGNPFLTAGLLIPEIAYAAGDYFAPETTTKVEEAVGAGYDKYVDPIVSPITGAISDKIGEIEAAQDVQEGIFRDDLIAQGADPNSQYFDEAVRGQSMSADELAEFEEMIKNPFPDFGMADGGRVGMFLGGSSGTVSPNQGAQSYNQSGFGGGLMNLISRNPLYQTMLQQYRQPTMNFSQVASSSIPQQTLASPTPAQAYTPFVSTMPLYDPSTLGTGLPSTAGMADPYTVYDPYSPVGAFDTPKARTTGFLSREQIDKGFADVDKYSLAKQREKRKAEEEAKKKKAKKPGGGGGEGRGRNHPGGRGGLS